MPAGQIAANGAVNAAKWLGRGIQGAKDLAKHALVQDAKPIFQAARASLMKGDFAVQAAAYGAVGGATGYALSDDPKRGIRDGIALGVLGAAGHRLFTSSGLRSAFKGYGETLGRYAEQGKNAVEAAAAGPARTVAAVARPTPGQRNLDILQRRAVARKPAPLPRIPGPSAATRNLNNLRGNQFRPIRGSSGSFPKDLRSFETPSGWTPSGFR